jgi:hypothetical protein
MWLKKLLNQREPWATARIIKSSEIFAKLMNLAGDKMMKGLGAQEDWSVSIGSVPLCVGSGSLLSEELNQGFTVEQTHHRLPNIDGGRTDQWSFLLQTKRIYIPACGILLIAFTLTQSAHTRNQWIHSAWCHSDHNVLLPCLLTTNTLPSIHQSSPQGDKHSNNMIKSKLTENDK